MKQRLISAGILLAIVLTCVFVSDITRVLFFGAGFLRLAQKETVHLPGDGVDQRAGAAGCGQFHAGVVADNKRFVC